MARQPTPLAQAFWSKVDRRGDDECWPWTGKRNHKGYARLQRQGRDLSASQIAWKLANGREFPAGLYALHRCDNPACVNPAHIWPGTQRENIADMISKGRARFGFREPGPCRGCQQPHIPGQRCLVCKRAYDAEHRDRKREYDRARRTSLQSAI